MIAENQITYGHAGKLLANTGVDRPKKLAFGEQSEKALLKSSYEKCARIWFECIFSWSCELNRI